MQDIPTRRHAFVVRIWQEQDQRWRGWVQHAGSQEATYIQNLADLLSFIQDRTGGLVEHRAEGLQAQAERLARESVYSCARSRIQQNPISDET